MGGGEIVRADAAARGVAVRIVVLAALVGAATLHWGRPWLVHAAERAVAEGMPRSVVCRSVLVALAGLGCGTGAFGVHAFRLGRRVMREQRYPPKGLRVIRDTRVVEGRVAELVGTVQSGTGILLVAASAALVAVAAYGFAKLSL